MNPRLPYFVALAGVFALGLVPCAGAVEYTSVNTTASTISFTYHQMGSKNYGTFNKFEAKLVFDTQNPEAALAAIEMAMAGIEFAIPADEVIDTMGEIGAEMDVRYRETAGGGLAATPTGRRLAKERLYELKKSGG